MCQLFQVAQRSLLAKMHTENRYVNLEAIITFYPSKKYHNKNKQNKKGRNILFLLFGCMVIIVHIGQIYLCVFDCVVL